MESAVLGRVGSSPAHGVNHDDEIGRRGGHKNSILSLFSLEKYYYRGGSCRKLGLVGNSFLLEQMVILF